MSRTKDSTNQNGDDSLDGLVIDWNAAEYDKSHTPVGVLPTNQPSYTAYAA